eukprot:gnl/MRDRNA2_/MRDRNA2_15225_c0_seq1.p1 gnl/MRDRNA2_/MRDRNA2_15225_c0~~gnl/MRDRNA2_/MRDRNA2_15225_c0_seq1.p1  ORF type:complete len:889 (-),score=182.75 gnl/MRDRNA2_/MRDRNA2_15225_c0_seq1:7-2673(-)
MNAQNPPRHGEGRLRPSRRRAGSKGDDVASDDSGDDSSKAVGSGQGALLESNSLQRQESTEVAAEPVQADEDDEGVFEIRDFTTASSFERLVHRVSLALKKWTEQLNKAQAAASSKAENDNSQMLKERFEHQELQYELICQTTLDTEVATTQQRGLQRFPSKAHRLERWFGVRHFAILGIRDRRNIDVDSARTILSALSMASRAMGTAPIAEPLTCFVMVDGGRRRRYIGEQTVGGLRTLCHTDFCGSVDPGLEHLAGLTEFFWQKFGRHSEKGLAIAARFTFIADEFPPFLEEGEAESQNFSVSRSRDVAEGEEGSMMPEENQTPMDVADPVDTLQLHCIWPSFPNGSFVDNAVYSELDARMAPYWRLRLLPATNPRLPRSGRLKQLLAFRDEATVVRSAEHSIMPTVPKTALASLSVAIQESLESILLPSAGELMDLTQECLDAPVVGDRAARGSKSPALRGAPRDTRLAKIARFSGEMKCFKGVLVLWGRLLAELRQEWEHAECAQPGMSSAGPPPRLYYTKRFRSSVRTERFSPLGGIVQQKFEMLHSCLVARRRGTLVSQPSQPTKLKLQNGKSQIWSPQLVPPQLMTEDMIEQQCLALQSMTSDEERAEFTAGRELRSDMACFKKANPDATLTDFQAWRRSLPEKLDDAQWPAKWQQDCWLSAAPQAACDQQPLFEPEREAEMALHYLENIDGMQLLIEVLQANLRIGSEELAEGSTDCSWQHDLQRRLETSISEAFPVNSEGAAPLELPSDEQMEAVLRAFEEYEKSVRLQASLEQKLSGLGKPLLKELEVESEVTVSTESQRRCVEEVVLRSRAYSLGYSMNAKLPQDGLFAELPFSKEFIFLPAGSGSENAKGASGSRMYAEVRENHLRIATCHCLRMI